MSDKIIDAFVKKIMEYIRDDKISDKEYLKAYDRLVKRWIAEAGTSVQDLNVEIGKAARKALRGFRAG